jgi:uncharacterized FlaG/YvyC family protein
MPNNKTIQGIQRGPDFEREVFEPHRVEKTDREQKVGRRVQANDPLIKAAVDAGREIAGSMGQKVDLKWDPNSELLIMRVMSEDGKEVIREIPPEEVIRTAQRLKENGIGSFESIA